MVNERKTILVADDDNSTRTLVVDAFELDLPDYDIETFSNGLDLDERINKGLENVCAVVTDNEMPGMNCSDIIRIYARKHSNVPFILYYGGDKSIGERAMEEGAGVYFIKSEISILDFADYIKRMLE